MAFFSLSFYHYSMLAAEGRATHDDFWYPLISISGRPLHFRSQYVTHRPLGIILSFFPVSLVESSAVKMSIISHLLKNIGGV